MLRTTTSGWRACFLWFRACMSSVTLDRAMFVAAGAMVTVNGIAAALLVVPLTNALRLYAVLFGVAVVALLCLARRRVADLAYVVDWNINRGLKLNGIVDFLSGAGADLILLQECDLNARGTHRLNIAQEIARRLRMNYVFGREFQELTQGSNESPAYHGQQRSHDGRYRIRESSGSTDSRASGGRDGFCRTSRRCRKELAGEWRWWWR